MSVIYIFTVPTLLPGTNTPVATSTLHFDMRVGPMKSVKYGVKCAEAPESISHSVMYVTGSSSPGCSFRFTSVWHVYSCVLFILGACAAFA